MSLSKSLFKGESTMHVQLAISETIHQVFVTIHGPQLTPAIKELQQNIEALTNQQFINAFQDRSLIKLPLQSVSRFYTANKRLYCETTTGAYLVHSHLHTLMDQLTPHQFLRISSSEIVRIACVKNFTLTKWGSFQVNLTTGHNSYRLLTSKSGPPI
ncbi:LytTR family transcriptional regulator [Lactiplantibacillus paraplantarum]|uniref:LytTR family transcriptional regulator n=1 Tax=Lactiplantibacillus paraplantarum TaxID=60520 RepID=A0A4Q9Y621_9LACO|nr:LytTR family transcriptional regulator [Lactiplantibacillus paraplantarum]